MDDHLITPAIIIVMDVDECSFQWMVALFEWAFLLPSFLPGVEFWFTIGFHEGTRIFFVNASSRLAHAGIEIYLDVCMWNLYCLYVGRILSDSHTLDEAKLEQSGVYIILWTLSFRLIQISDSFVHHSVEFESTFTDFSRWSSELWLVFRENRISRI